MTSTSALVAWLTTAMLQWTPTHGAFPERAAYLDLMAREILTVAYSGDETPVYKGHHARARTALLVASIASIESKFEPRIQAGRCEEGECDHGKSFCFMQIQPGPGIVLFDNKNEWAYSTDWNAKKATSAKFIANDLLDGANDCFRVGLHMARKALRGSHNLCSYVGEHGDCPGAQLREFQSDDYFKSHAPPMSDADVFASAP